MDLFAMTDKRSRGNTKGTVSHHKRKSYQVASETSAKLSSVFPDCPEGKLMHSILRSAIFDALSPPAPKRKDDAGALFARDNYQKAAKRTLSEKMWFCTVAGVSNSYIRRVMKSAYKAVENDLPQ